MQRTAQKKKMAVIYYGIQGEGMGHSTRSKPIIEYLKKNNEVIIFCGGRAYQYLSQHFDDVQKITSPHIFYTKNKTSTFRTILLNALKMPHFFASYFKIAGMIKNKKPDVIITDFEPVTNYYGLFNKIPTISIDNQHTISSSDIEYPDSKKVQKDETELVIKLMIWKARKYFMINFFFPKVLRENSYFVKPIIRNEVQKLKPSKKNFVLVYQTAFTDTHLVPALIASGEKMVVYGYHADIKNSNVKFAQFNEKGFFNDLKNCKAVITNGGQSLICEALYLKKPVLSIPVKNQFEQYINASYIDKMGFGEFHDEINEEIIKGFLSRLNIYEKKLEKQRMIGNNDLFKKLDKAIFELVSKKKK